MSRVLLGRGSSLKINKLVAATVMPVLALGSMVAMGGSASAQTARPNINITGHVTISPSTNIVNGTTITIKASNFNTALGTMLYAIECDPHAVSGQDDTYCDINKADAATPVPAVAGAGTLTIKALTGSNFKPTHKGAACGFGFNANQCIIVVTDQMTPTPSTDAGFAFETFKDTRAVTKNKLKGKKSAKAKSKVTFKVATIAKGSAVPTGKVIVKDNGKKVATGKEKNGKATVKFTIKKGKNKLTAAYAGNTVCKPSTGKATITGK
jgi:Bacterial Ig-like domain (group 3)